MNHFFYPRLALTSLRKNKSVYTPYLMVSALMVMMFYILRSIRIMLVQVQVTGGESMGIILDMSLWVCGIFSLIILFYVNSFVMKRRAKEFGLFSILGMEKRHMAILAGWEVLFCAVGSIGVGILCGALLSQLMFLLLLNLVQIETPLTFQIPLDALWMTIELFLAAWVVILLRNIHTVGKADPIALLQSRKEGEKEPKTRRLLALLGAVTLGGGYWIALTAATPSEALAFFLPAVLLVMAGTYCLFTAGSIAFLKFLKRRKGFYYRPNNFISVSGMLYRMKQNAVSLANICILSTAVLVTLSFCVSLYLGEEGVLQAQFPRQVQSWVYINSPEEEQDGEDWVQLTRQTADKHGVTLQNEVKYHRFTNAVIRQGEAFSFFETQNGTVAMLECIPLEEYNAITGSQETLEPGQVLAFDPTGTLGEEMTIDGHRYQIKKKIEAFAFGNSMQYLADCYTVVMKDLPTLWDLLEQINEKPAADGSGFLPVLRYSYWYDPQPEKEEALNPFFNQLWEDYRETHDGGLSIQYEEDVRENFFVLYGSIFFVGLFFVLMFLIATVLMIYYKQITEGFEDHDRFRIMEQVGMSGREVKATIGKQVLMVFFLPLGMSVVHAAVAFPVLCKILSAIGMTQTSLFLWCLGISILVFALFYLVVYLITARVYYKIVRS